MKDLLRNDMDALNERDDDDDDHNDAMESIANLKISRSTLRALVIFLFIIAILLCIALALVIIWR